MSSGLLLGAPFSDHMVLQRERRNLLWGWDQPQLEVRVTLEGQGRRESLRARAASKDGRFEVELPALPAGGPYTLSIEGSSTQRIEDVLVGEVWIASGQSNMEWTVAMSDGAEREIAEAEHPELRCLYVTRTPNVSPAQSVSASWRVVSPESVGDVSAVGYFFARELQRALKVPIGFVDAAWGGTRVEAWTSADALARVLDLRAELARHHLAPEQLEAARSEYSRQILAWQKANLPAEPGPGSGTPAPASPETSTAGWRELRTPGSWQSAGMRFNGVVWYRREIELPANLAGSELLLSLGAIDDFDHSYFNGRLVGSHPAGTPEAHQIRRKYAVPGALVKAGRNVVAVRVFDHVGEGGLMGPAHELYLESRGTVGERLSLAGDWRAHVELEIPLVPASVFATYPPAPPALQPQNAPAALWNGMIAPLVPFGIAGALFYQGESNVYGYADYRPRFIALIRDWRVQFGQGQFPFFYAQLAGFRAGDDWPLLREAQAEARTEPRTGMACTIDIGAEDDIHPRNKLDVGRRLARLALREHYGDRSVTAQGPCLSELRVRGRTAVVRLSHAEGLTTTDGELPRGFELASRDGVFHAAVARIEGASVLLESERVARPSAARYAFHDFVDVNLVSAAGLPAEPFRTG